MTGLAGAMAAAVEGVEGVYNNAAAPAVREPFSLKWFDYDLSAGVSFPGAYGGTDFANRGERGNAASIERTDDFTSYNVGAQLQFGELGLTAMGDFLRYDVAAPGADSVALTLGRIHAVAGYGLFNNQVVVGAGARVVFVNLAEQATDGALVSMAGAAPQVGLVVKPDDAPFRVGATARAAVTASDIRSGRTVVDPVTGIRHAGGLITPDRITQPWEVDVGVAYQLGPRPLNPAWIDPRQHEARFRSAIRDRASERQARGRAELDAMPTLTDEDRRARSERAAALARDERLAAERDEAELRDANSRLLDERRARYLNWPRERLLLLASLLVTGPSAEAVALEGFIDQRRELVGQRASFAPRLAAESEPIPNLLRLRGGIYFEPSRFSDGTTRQHFTFGSDLRLLTWNAFGLIANTTFRASAFLDLAPRYTNFGFSIGTWH